MADIVAAAIGAAVILAAAYFAHINPAAWPACMAVMCAAGVGCLAYFWLTGDDI